MKKTPYFAFILFFALGYSVAVNQANASGKLSYQEKLDQAYSQNKALVDKELAPLCGPVFDQSCLLNAAVTRLQTIGFEDKEALATLMALADTIAKTDDKELMSRTLVILQSLKTVLVPGERKLRVAIMKLQFASGDFSSGLKTLRSFKKEKEPFPFSETPSFIAISFLIERNDLYHANQIAHVTQGWPLNIGPPPMFCFSGSTKADVIIKLMAANLEAEKFDDILALIPLITEKGSLYYAENVIDNALLRLGNGYVKNSNTKKAPKDMCKKFQKEIKKLISKESVFTALGQWGCQDERIILAKQIQSQTSPSEKNNRFYREVRIVLGDGAQLLQEASQIQNRKERLKQYSNLTRLFYFNNYPDLKENALSLSMNLYREIKAEPGQQDVRWITELIYTLRAIGQGKDLDLLYDSLVQEAKATGDRTLIKHLADWMQSSEHPDYEWLARTADKLWAEDNALNLSSQVVSHHVLDYKIKKAQNFIQQGNAKEANRIYKSLGKADRFYASEKLFSALFKAEVKGKLFQELWPVRMKSCLKHAILRRNLNEPSILVPGCINQFVKEGLGTQH